MDYITLKIFIDKLTKDDPEITPLGAIAVIAKDHSLDENKLIDIYFANC